MNIKLKNKKQGFTIVELVIVIAVIGILSAILIPTFAGLISKARLTADQHAVAQMNTSLLAEEAISGKPENYEQASEVLKKAGFNVPSDTVSEGYLYVWDAELNRVFLYNTRTEKAEHPQDVVESLGEVKGFETGRWFSLANAQENPEEPVPPVVSQDYNPKIKIVSDSTNNYTLALDESSVADAEWSRYEITLRIPFYLAKYTKENKSTDSNYEKVEQDFFTGYMEKSTLSEQYKLDFTYSVIKGANGVYIPYSQMTAFAFWDIEHWLGGNIITTSYNITKPDGQTQLVNNVRYTNWGDADDGYYSVSFTAISGIDIVDGLLGENASNETCLIQNEEEIPTYIINLYDNNNNLIGSTTYPPMSVSTAEYLETYINEYKAWLGEKEDSFENLHEYLLANKFETTQLEIQDIISTAGIGNTASEKLASYVMSIATRTSTFENYKIIVKVNDSGKLVKEYSPLV